MAWGKKSVPKMPWARSMLSGLGEKAIVYNAIGRSSEAVAAFARARELGYNS
jgi:hypothetical protein